MTTLHDYWYDYIERCKQSPFDLNCDTYPAATSKQIQAIEQKYNITLPTSYKALLEVTNGFDFFTAGHTFYSIDKIQLLCKGEQPEIVAEELWDEPLEDQKYQFLKQDLDFFYNRHLDVVNQEGDKVVYPPKGYFFSQNGRIVDIDGKLCVDPPTNLILRSTEVLSRMQNNAVLFKYSDYPHLVSIGHRDDYGTFYYFNTNSEPQKGEPEIWLVSYDDALGWTDSCLKFLNFIELAEYLLLEYGG
ncbi:SMI1/KNR4 family protein [Candidatus Albibeggiatoa sp. nov. NOAA]|uniref:SMI1/KNR4 family protein n=1 Tax=Candidatus Albibeggiatoa sp. nov. NOAA TaxID=3162724 RepID=UPI003300FCA6|nr:SMI1/KNR4 family protein [Thiotrichaceae bacterium]